MIIHTSTGYVGRSQDMLFLIVGVSLHIRVLQYLTRLFELVDITHSFMSYVYRISTEVLQDVGLMFSTPIGLRFMLFVFHKQFRIGPIISIGKVRIQYIRCNSPKYVAGF